ncbi:hypothetical protein PRIPAC_80106 [Pristionchus pacificus]|uniref:Uncharacterized protein n=1 Tax=Pristionchus pacificus TaxID=54126 RepID=A0A2A6BXC2_PRIPA|nr:hypothetical protein PRIPAC_80106 [Pristionchus pacificus]|eukprot:PDM70411.1 hypothetical protein PRIPAC_46657 [Pristionchus pacificus]
MLINNYILPDGRSSRVHDGAARLPRMTRRRREKLHQCLRKASWARLAASVAAAPAPPKHAPAAAARYVVPPPPVNYMAPPPAAPYQGWAAPANAPYMNASIYDPYLPPTAAFPRFY